MAKFSQIQSNFSSGELSERLDGRVDLQEYIQGLLRMENFHPLKTGGSYYRPGAKFLAEFPAGIENPTLIPYSYRGEDFVIVLEPRTIPPFTLFEVYNREGVLQPSGIDTGVTAGLIQDIDKDGFTYVQFNDVLFLAHNSGLVPPFTITLDQGFFSARSLLAYTTTPDPLSNILPLMHTPYDDPNSDFAKKMRIEATGTPGVLEIVSNFAYFTADHIGSVIRIINDNDDKEVFVHVLTFNSATSVEGPYIYYTALPLSTDYRNWRESAWSPHRGYPKSVTAYQQRLVYGSTSFDPSKLWISFVANPFHMLQERFVNDVTNTSGAVAYDGDLTDSDAYSVGIFGASHSDIVWMNPRNTLDIGTRHDEFTLRPVDGSVLGPLTTEVIPLSSRGGSPVGAVTLGDGSAYIDRNGKNLRTMRFSLENGSKVNNNLSILSEDIVNHNSTESIEGNKFKFLQWQEATSTLWCLTSTGQIVGITNEESSKVLAWSRMSIGSAVQISGMCTASNVDSTSDDLFLSVERVIDGVTKFFLERVSSLRSHRELIPVIGVNEQYVYLDSHHIERDVGGLASITALHLADQEVSLVQDGVYIGEVTPDVTGLVTLVGSPTVAAIGFKYQGTMTSMKIEAGSQIGSSQGSISRIDRISLKLFRSISGKFGSSLENMYDMEIDNEVGQTFTGNIVADFDQTPDEEIQYHIVQDKPQPLTILGITMRGKTQD